MRAAQRSALVLSLSDTAPAACDMQRVRYSMQHTTCKGAERSRVCCAAGTCSRSYHTLRRGTALRSPSTGVLTAALAHPPTGRQLPTRSQCTTRLRDVQALKIDATLASAYYNLANAHRNRKDVPDVNHGAAEVDRDSVNKEVLESVHPIHSKGRRLHHAVGHGVAHCSRYSPYLRCAAHHCCCSGALARTWP